MIFIRPMCFPNDADGILALDTSFETDRIYGVESTESLFQLTEISANLTKQYTLKLDDLEMLAPAEHTIVASMESDIVGFTAAEYADWNRRVILHHLYVARDYRRLGIGRLLLQNVIDWSRTTAARCLWLETQNVNYPAIQFYRQAGFSLCGFDSSLYDPIKTETDEVAIFLYKPLGPLHSRTPGAASGAPYPGLFMTCSKRLQNAFQTEQA